MPKPTKEIEYVHCLGAGTSKDGKTVFVGLELKEGEEFAFRSSYLGAGELLLELMKGVAMAQTQRAQALAPGSSAVAPTVGFNPTRFQVEMAEEPRRWVLRMEMNHGPWISFLLEDSALQELIAALAEARPTKSN